MGAEQGDGQVPVLFLEDADLLKQNSLSAFERAKVEHGTSKAGSRSGTSVVSGDVKQKSSKEEKEEDKLFASNELS